MREPFSLDVKSSSRTSTSMPQNPPYHDFLEHVVKSIVDEPDQVRVERKVDEMGVLLTLRVSRSDMGKVVGRNGSTAKSLRTLLRIVGVKNNARVNLKIEEPKGSMPRGPQETREDTSVDRVVEDLKL